LKQWESENIHKLHKVGLDLTCCCWGLHKWWGRKGKTKDENNSVHYLLNSRGKASNRQKAEVGW